MGILSIFSGKDPENYEQKGDALFEANAYGKAVVEYERALDRLGKTSPWDDGYRQNLQDKIRTGKESLAREHQQTAESLMEAGHDYDARQYIDLALELTEDPELKNALEQQLQNREDREAEDIENVLPDVETQNHEPDYEDEPVEEPPNGEEDDEYFSALIGTLPDDVQDAYLGYGKAFKTGYQALNQGRFRKSGRAFDHSHGRTSRSGKLYPHRAGHSLPEPWQT